ncbi:MAG: antibiotic biosynthesis monooxygenase [Armatimonadetes bacterium]|nr:antibiotic biosynthesis monooxygenase [Armatimonadota bacterium]
MPYVLVRHKVEDYTRWQPVFDENTPLRQARGSKGGYVFRNIDNPSEVIVLLEWENLEKARHFMQSEELKAAMRRGGVAEQPDIYFLEEVTKPSV